MIVSLNTKHYFQAAMDSVVPIISKKILPTKELNEALLSDLRGEPKKQTTPVNLNRDEQLAVKRFHEIIEIHDCVERLKDCETYIGTFPFKNSRITRDAYLQLVIEAHLHEIYLLRERIVKHSIAIARQFRKGADAEQVKIGTDFIGQFIAQALNGFTRARGSHVHDQRYQHADIDRLRLIATLRKGPASPFTRTMKSFQTIATDESHARLKTQARNWNKIVAKALEQCCTVLLPIVFEPNKKSFRYPKSTAKPNPHSGRSDKEQRSNPSK